MSDTAASQQVTLEPASQSDAPVLANLLELYVHDLSPVFGLELGPDGRFGYEKLPLYWSQPEQRLAFLVRCAGRLAGFALVTRGSPGSDDPQALDVAEFFIVRRHRRAGVGREAAFLLWDRVPGSWIVRVSEGNQPGCDFWSGTVAAYAPRAFQRSARPGKTHPWRVFSFATRSRAPLG